MPNPDRTKAVVAEVVRLIKIERETRGLSMNTVAQRAGLSQSSLSLLENNKRTPTLDTLLRIGEVLDVDIGVIVSTARRNLRK